MIDAVYANSPTRGRIKAWNEIDERALPRPTRSDECDDLAFRAVKSMS